MSAAQPNSAGREIPDSQPDFPSVASSQDGRNRQDNDHRSTRASTPYPKKRSLVPHSSRALQQPSQSSPNYIRHSDNDNDSERCGSDSEQGSVVDNLRSSGSKHATSGSAIDGNRHIVKLLKEARKNVGRLISEEEAKKTQNQEKSSALKRDRRRGRKELRRLQQKKRALEELEIDFEESGNMGLHVRWRADRAR